MACPCVWRQHLCPVPQGQGLSNVRCLMQMGQQVVRIHSFLPHAVLCHVSGLVRIASLWNLPFPSPLVSSQTQAAHRHRCQLSFGKLGGNSLLPVDQRQPFPPQSPAGHGQLLQARQRCSFCFQSHPGNAPLRTWCSARESQPSSSWWQLPSSLRATVHDWIHFPSKSAELPMLPSSETGNDSFFLNLFSFHGWNRAISPPAQLWESSAEPSWGWAGGRQVRAAKGWGGGGGTNVPSPQFQRLCHSTPVWPWLLTVGMGLSG